MVFPAWSGVSPGRGSRSLPAREQDEQGENPASHVMMLSQADAAEAPGQNYGPALDLCSLEEKTSARGTTYLAGWLGSARIVVVRIDGAEGEPPRFKLRLTGKAQDAARTAPPRTVLDGPSPGAGERQQAALPFRGAACTGRVRPP